MANISSTELEDVGRIVIKDAKGEDTDIVFVVAGPAHPARQKLDRQSWRKGASEFNRKGRISLHPDAEQVFDEQTDRLVALTLGWENVQDASGTPITFTPEALRAIYENRRSTVRAQVIKGLDDAENFTTSSSAS